MARDVGKLVYSKTCFFYLNSFVKEVANQSDMKKDFQKFANISRRICTLIDCSKPTELLKIISSNENFQESR